MLEDASHLIVVELAEEVRRTKGVDISRQRTALEKLHEAVEKAVKDLQTQEDVELYVPFLTTDEVGAVHFRHRLAREDAMRMADVRDVAHLLD